MLYRQTLLVVLLLAALLRLQGMTSEMWFDEIWSYEFARAADSPWQIFLGSQHHHDNNHKLNTLYLWICPQGIGWGWYRVHSFVAGVAAVALAALAARQRGRAEALFAALLFAVNYWLILCSTEARGYALAVCFALLALMTLRQYFTCGGRIALIFFWGSVILGFCSHLTFLHCYFALGLWSVYDLARRRTSPGAEIKQLLACHAVPVLFLLALYLFDVRGMELGGGPPASAGDVIGRLFALGLGVPPSTVGMAIAAGFAGVVLILGLRLLAHDRHHVGIFFLAVVLGSPALFLLGKPVYVFERYFLIPFVFFLLLLSYFLGSLWRRSWLGATLAGLIAVGLALGSVAQTPALAQGGRGRFLEALHFIENQTSADAIRVSGDYDFRVRKFFTFYVAYLPDAKRFVYHEQSALPPGGADWLLVHRLDDRHPPPLRMYDSADNAYRRVGEFPVENFAGWTWYVYRNEHPGG